MSVMQVNVPRKPHWSEPAAALSVATEARKEMWWGFVFLVLEIVAVRLLWDWVFTFPVETCLGMVCLLAFALIGQSLLVVNRLRTYHFWMTRYTKGLQENLKVELALMGVNDVP